MTGGDFVLSTKMFQSVMVCVKNELFMEQVVTPMFNCLDNSVKFDILRAVAKTRTRDLFTKVGDRPVLLAKNGANTCLRCITMQLENGGKVR